MQTFKNVYRCMSWKTLRYFGVIIGIFQVQRRLSRAAEEAMLDLPYILSCLRQCIGMNNWEKKCDLLIVYFRAKVTGLFALHGMT